MPSSAHRVVQLRDLGVEQHVVDDEWLGVGDPVLPRRAAPDVGAVRVGDAAPGAEVDRVARVEEDDGRAVTPTARSSASRAWSKTASSDPAEATAPARENTAPSSSAWRTSSRSMRPRSTAAAPRRATRPSASSAAWSNRPSRGSASSIRPSRRPSRSRSGCSSRLLESGLASTASSQLAYRSETEEAIAGGSPPSPVKVTSAALARAADRACSARSTRIASRSTVEPAAALSPRPASATAPTLSSPTDTVSPRVQKCADATDARLHCDAPRAVSSVGRAGDS